MREMMKRQRKGERKSGRGEIREGRREEKEDVGGRDSVMESREA